MCIWRVNLCKEYIEDATLRGCLIGATQFCLDLCVALNLPIEVATTSLQYIHIYITEFDWQKVEFIHMVGACVLLTWKFHEDLYPIKSSRKLIELSEEILKLLFYQTEYSHQMTPESMQKCQFYQNSVNDIKFLNEGKEIQRIRDRLRVYENCLLRCINFQITPFELPFPYIKYLCRHIYNAEIESNEFKHSLSTFIYISYGIIIDYYRTPFCLVSDPENIGLAAVWKAAITLGIQAPFKDILSQDDSNVNRFPIKNMTEHKLILNRMRQMYQWMQQFISERKLNPTSLT